MKHLLLLLSILSLFTFSCSKEEMEEKKEERCDEKGYYHAKEITNPNDAFFDLTANYWAYNNSSSIRIDMDSIQPDGSVDEGKGSLYLPLADRLVYRGIDFQEQVYSGGGTCNTTYVYYKQERGDGILSDTIHWETEDNTYHIPLTMKEAVPPADTIIFPSPAGAMYYWKGEPLGPNEMVRLQIVTQVNDSTTWEFNYSTNLVGATGIHIHGNDLYDLTGFFSWVSISRHQSYYIGQSLIPYGSGHIQLNWYHEDAIMGVW
ncbi:MAG: hypothetical protein MK212_05300 [Saprospiraceae bacterium]|nr:hypothetical protein [Saprospiraceae bacterium]